MIFMQFYFQKTVFGEVEEYQKKLLIFFTFFAFFIYQ
jgi:hypothetical protein